MRWALLILGVVAGIVAIVVVGGMLLPQAHVASRTAVVHAPPQDVWGTLTEIGAYPRWRSDVTSVEVLPDANGHARWKESGKNGNITFEMVEADAPRRMVGRIADPDLPFGGSWTYELAPADGGTRLTITERGEVYNPVFRFLSRFVFGHAATMEAYLRDLGRKYGEDVRPEPAMAG